MGPLAEFMAAAAGEDQLDEAMAGLHRIALAAGLYETTWAAASVTEVSEIIAAWCKGRRGQSYRPGGGGVMELMAGAALAAGQGVILAANGLVFPAGRGLPFGVVINPAGYGQQVYVRVPPYGQEPAGE